MVICWRLFAAQAVQLAVLAAGYALLFYYSAHSSYAADLASWFLALLAARSALTIDSALLWQSPDLQAVSA